MTNGKKTRCVRRNEMREMGGRDIKKDLKGQTEEFSFAIVVNEKVSQVSFHGSDFI
jgi:hypothetical protein